MPPTTPDSDKYRDAIIIREGPPGSFVRYFDPETGAEREITGAIEALRVAVPERLNVGENVIVARTERHRGIYIKAFDSDSEQEMTLGVFKPSTTSKDVVFHRPGTAIVDLRSSAIDNPDGLVTQENLGGGLSIGVAEDLFTTGALPLIQNTTVIVKGAEEIGSPDQFFNELIETSEISPLVVHTSFIRQAHIHEHANYGRERDPGTPEVLFQTGPALGHIFADTGATTDGGFVTFQSPDGTIREVSVVPEADGLRQRQDFEFELGILISQDPFFLDADGTINSQRLSDEDEERFGRNQTSDAVKTIVDPITGLGIANPQSLLVAGGRMAIEIRPRPELERQHPYEPAPATIFGPQFSFERLHLGWFEWDKTIPMRDPVAGDGLSVSHPGREVHINNSGGELPILRPAIIFWDVQDKLVPPTEDAIIGLTPNDDNELVPKKEEVPCDKGDNHEKDARQGTDEKADDDSSDWERQWRALDGKSIRCPKEWWPDNGATRPQALTGSEKGVTDPYGRVILTDERWSTPKNERIPLGTIALDNLDRPVGRVCTLKDYGRSWGRPLSRSTDGTISWDKIGPGTEGYDFNISPATLDTKVSILWAKVAAMANVQDALLIGNEFDHYSGNVAAIMSNVHNKEKRILGSHQFGLKHYNFSIGTNYPVSEFISDIRLETGKAAITVNSPIIRIERRSAGTNVTDGRPGIRFLDNNDSNTASNYYDITSSREKICIGEHTCLPDDKEMRFGSSEVAKILYESGGGTLDIDGTSVDVRLQRAGSDILSIATTGAAISASKRLDWGSDLRLSRSAAGILGISDASGFRALLDASGMTADRTLTLQNKSLTVAGYDTEQTWTSGQTFSGASVTWNDNDEARYGTSGAEGRVYSDGTDFLIDAKSGKSLKLTANTTVRFEIDGTGLGFFAVTPVAQESTTGLDTGHTQGDSSAVFGNSTFTGNTGTKAYTISDIVRALKNYGLLAGS